MTDNPYATPAADLAVTLPRQLFPELSTKEVKQLKDHGTNIRVMGILWVFTVIIALVLGISTFSTDPLGASVTLALGIGFAALVYGCFARPAWARIPGMIGAALSLPAFPLGTIIGALALWSFYKGKALFGEDRIQPADLAKELKYRKANKID
jgi:hypothetical protein